MNIVGKKITLRAIEVNDIPLLHQWSNDPEIWNLLGGWHFPYSERNTQKWFENIDNNNLINHVFAITTEKDGLIGTANLVNIDWKNKNAFHGMVIGNKKNRGRGYAQDTVMTIMRYAFDELGLNRLDGDMISYNKLSINFYKKRCGWEVEGFKSKWFYRNGEYHDKVIVGITKEKYKTFVKSTSYWNS